MTSSRLNSERTVLQDVNEMTSRRLAGSMGYGVGGRVAMGRSADAIVHQTAANVAANADSADEDEDDDNASDENSDSSPQLQGRPSELV